MQTLQRRKNVKNTETALESAAKLRSCDKDVIALMKWWLSDNLHYKRMAMSVGGYSEVIQETCLNIVKYVPRELSIHWTTGAIKNLRWTLCRLVRKKLNHLESNTHLREVSSRWPNGFCNGVVEYDLIADIHQAELAERVCHVLNRALQSGRGNTILRHRLEGDTLEQIGSRYRVGKECIRQIESHAIRVLQQPRYASLLVGFLD